MKNLDFDAWLGLMFVLALSIMLVQMPGCVKMVDTNTENKNIEAIKNGCSIINSDYYCNGEFKKIYGEK